jgi:hypothetical protein
MPLPADTPRSGGTGNCAGKPIPVKVIRYKSNPGFIGTDTFSYKAVSDGVTAPYDFTITVTAASAAAPLFLGCFKEQGHEDLGGDNALVHSDALTGAQCAATCRSRGYRFAATQYGSMAMAFFCPTRTTSRAFSSARCRRCRPPSATPTPARN